MSDLLTALRLVITGDSSGAVTALGEVGAATGKLSKEQAAAAKAQAAAQDAAVSKGRAGLGLMAGGLGLVAGAVYGSLKAYGTFAEAVVQVQRETNLSAQSASRLVGEWQTMGMSVESGGRYIARYSKNFQAAIDPTAKSTNAAVKAFKMLGLAPAQLKSMGADAALATVRDKLASMQDHAKRTAAELALFGRGATDSGFQRWLTTSASGMAKLDEQLKSAGLIWNEQQVGQAEKFGGTLRAIEEEFKAAGVAVGQSLVPAISDLLGVVLPVLAVFNKLPGPVRAFLTLAPGFLVMAAGAGKLVSGLRDAKDAGMTAIGFLQRMVAVQKAGTAATLIQKAATLAQAAATKVAAAAQWLFNAAMDANPIGLIVLAIAAVIAIVVVMAIKFKWFREIFVTIWHGIEAVFKAVIDFLGKHWKTFLGMLAGPLGVVIGLMISHWQSIKAAFKAVWDWLLKGWKAAVHAMEQPVKAVVGSAIKVFKTLVGPVTAVAGAIKAAFWAAVHGIADAFHWVYQQILNRIGDLEKIPILGQLVKVGFSIGKLLTGGGSSPAHAAPAPRNARSAAVPPGVRAYAGGGDFMTSGPQLIMVGEGGPEHVQITPQNSRQGAAPQAPSITINIGEVHGTDSQAARQFANAVSSIVMQRLRMASATGF